MEENKLGLSVVYALIAAIVGGTVWALIAVLANYELGIIAWAIGGMAGYAVVIPSKENITPAHQVVAVIASLIGILLGKYFDFAYIVNDGFQGMFSSFTFSYFMEFFTELFGIMDIVFVILAIVTAWQIPMKFSEPDDIEPDVSKEDVN